MHNLNEQKPIDHDLSDEQLMQDVVEGDQAAYGLLVTRYSSKSYSIACRILLYSNDKSEEVVQDAFIRLWLKPHLFDSRKAKFSTWFYRVVMNRALDEKRKKTYLPLIDDGVNISDDRPSAFDQVASDQKSFKITKAIGSLSEKQQQALTLCYYEGFKNGEAALIMDMNIKAVESLLLRARRALKTILLKEDISI